MNTIQVGRPAVSRYHNSRKFYMTKEGVDYDVHDFPSAELGLKLGGFMVLTDTAATDDHEVHVSDSDEGGEQFDIDLGEEIPDVDFTVPLEI